jgi:hypothetical protein
MNCQEFWDQLPQRGNDITQEQTAHLAECSTCNTQWAPHQALAAALHSAGEEWRKMEAPSRVETGLTAAFRAQQSSAARRSISLSWWKPVFAWASAAAATIAVAGLLIHGNQPMPATPGRVAAPHRVTLPSVQVASATVSDTDSDDESAVLGEGFVRLPNAPRIEPNEDFNVVRVELPSSAVIDAGISLSDDQTAGTVMADVALASDGTPRAVRLVSDGGSN